MARADRTLSGFTVSRRILNQTNIRQGTTYVVVGLVATAINYTMFITTLRGGLHYLLAATVSSVVTVLAGYFLHRKFTFSRATPANFREFMSFLGVFAVQYFLSLWFYVLLIGYLKLGPSLAFVINSAAVALVAFVLLRSLTFRTR